MLTLCHKIPTKNSTALLRAIYTEPRIMNSNFYRLVDEILIPRSFEEETVREEMRKFFKEVEDNNISTELRFSNYYETRDWLVLIFEAIPSVIPLPEPSK